MSQTELRTRDGQATTVSDEAITALVEVLRGRLVQPLDGDYDGARQLTFPAERPADFVGKRLVRR